MDFGREEGIPTLDRNEIEQNRLVDRNREDEMNNRNLRHASKRQFLLVMLRKKRCQMLFK